jgi:hypothetical protein
VPRSAQPHDLEPNSVARIQLALALAHEAAQLLLLWEPFACGLDLGWLHETLRSRAERQIVVVFLGTPPEPPLPGPVFHFGRGAALAASHAPVPPRQGSLWVAAHPVEALAQELVQNSFVVGAEILLGEPGLLCVGIAAEPASAVQSVCAATLAIAREKNIQIRGLRFEPEGPR